MFPRISKRFATRLRTLSVGRGLIAFILSLAVTVLLLGIPVNPAYAATITVNSLLDSAGACPATCTLRAAIGAALPGDTINFSVSGTITLSSQLPILKNLTIDGTGHTITISGNHADRVFCVPGNTSLTINALTITNGKPSSSCNGDSSDGGGLYSNSTVTVTNSTFSGNSAGGLGGGISGSGAVTVTNSTFSGNSAFLEGGGILGHGSITLTNSTFSGNSAIFEVGGGLVSNGSVTVTNTIITNSPGGTCAGSGPFISTNSLIDDTNCGATLGTVTGLSTTLASNGGPTQTLALLVGSNAINAVPAGQCTVATDQRGYVRPAGPLCDIGAYEYGAVPPTSPITVTNSPVLDSCYQPNGSLVASVRINAPAGAAVAPNGAIATVFCQILTDPAQYNVTDQPVTMAIDVFALTGDGQSIAPFKIAAQVCLLGTGNLLFRDATQAPRITTTLTAFSDGGFTCANIPNAGTLILIVGAAAPAGSVGNSVSSHPLTTCTITTLYGLNIHATPNGSIIGAGVPPNVTLTATARAGDWIQVTYGSTTGWLSILSNLTLNGVCS